jgi:hypothetical protein
MRAKLAHSAILATAILTVAGCKSGPRWNWWSSKDKASQDALVNAPGAPQLPSAAATAGTPGTPSLTAGTPTTQAGLTGGMAPAYNASTSTSPYAEQPAAATSYGPGGYPATQTAEYTNPYAAPASAAPAVGSAPANAVQQGPYSQTYPQGTQTNPYADPYASSRQMPAQDASRGAGAAPSYGADPNYRGGDSGYRTADVRSTPGYDSRPAESPRYDVTTEMSSPDYTRPSYSPEGQPAAGSPAGSRYGDAYQPGTSDYKPGASDYTPGSTGYNGPRSYETNPPAGGAAPTGAVPSGVERKDPGYRPAGTSDYPSSGRVGGSAGAGFSNSMGATPAKSDVVPAGYQQPAGGDNAAAPARFESPESNTGSTLNFGRRSYE